jgi:hypothetical protein
MNYIFKPISRLLEKPNFYNKDISYYNSVICYISFFEGIKEEDYINYKNDRTFTYTPQFFSFLQALHEADLVETREGMKTFLATFNCFIDEKSSCYKAWVKQMNNIISDEKQMNKANISFVKKAFATMISLEKIIPGSLGIDIENGNILKLLNRLKDIYPEISTNSKANIS